MAAPGTEVKGSRREWEDNRFGYGEMLHVSDALGDKMTIGTFFTPVTGGQDSTVTGRKCVRVNVDTETLPGIFLFRSLHRGFKGYS